jgi:prepilin-type processing-associated H-X9-DG protein
VWQSLAKQGVELRIAKISSTGNNSPETEVTNLCDDLTRLISVSSVQYASGLKMDLDVIGNFCKTENILFCVDAIQSVGATGFDVQKCHANFAMADGHKWMLGPEGLGFFYCNENVRDQLKLTQYGWHMIENVGNFDEKDWQVARSARRFECGSPNMLAIHALHASLSLIEQIGMSEIEHRIHANTALMRDTVLDDANLELVSPSSLDRLAGIVTFRHKLRPNKMVYENLMKQGIMCAERGGGVRFSPHFYIDQQQIETALQQASQL